jgi:hypothetical protein
VSRFFKNSHEQLVLNLLEDQGIEPEELRRLRQMLIQNQPVQNDTVQNDTVHRNTVQNDSVRKEAK